MECEIVRPKHFPQNLLTSSLEKKSNANFVE